MNTNFHNTQPPSDSRSVQHPYHEGASAPLPAPKNQPVTCRDGRALLLVNGAEIASHICLKSGHPVHMHIKTSIRSPFNPVSWFRAADTAIIGLSRKELKKYKRNFSIARGPNGSLLLCRLAS